MLLVLRVVLGAALFWLVVSRTGGLRLALPALGSASVLGPVVAFSVAATFLETLRLLSLVRAQNVAVGFGQTFKLVTVAFAFNFCIPGGAAGDISKLVYLRAARTEMVWELATVVFVDRLVGLCSMLLAITLLGVGAWSFVQGSRILMSLFWIQALILAGIVGFAALCLSQHAAPRRVLARVIGIMPLRRYLSRIADALFRFSDHRAALARSLVYSFVGNVAAIAMFTALGWVLFARSPFPIPALLSLFGMFANAVTITPGGLGVGEAAFDRLFAEAGLEGGAAMMIAWRVGMLPLCLLGIAFYLTGVRMKPERGAADEAKRTQRVAGQP
jgi:uncharacterized protein (TIRG00374 family)